MGIIVASVSAPSFGMTLYTAAMAFRRAASLERDGLDPVRASAM